jgi:Flp pilus assembly protein TadG
VLVLFALWLPVLLGVVGLLYSFGTILTQRRALQMAADATSTAATWAVLTELQSGDRRDSVVVQKLQAYAAQVSGASVSGVYTDATGRSLSPVVAVGTGGAFPLNAAGVQVTLNEQVPAILGGFVGTQTVLTAATSTAALVSTSSPSAAGPVIPVCVSVTDFQNAMNSSATYDLFAPGTPPPGALGPMLDFAHSSPNAFAPAAQGTDYGYATSAPQSNDATGPSSIFTNLQYWSDGWHAPIVHVRLGANAIISLAPAAPLPQSAFRDPQYTAQQILAYRDAVAAGVRSNVTNQGLADASGRPYGLVTVPLWDTVPSAGTVHIAAFATIRLRQADISSTSAPGQFVPYPAAAWGLPQVPAVDSRAVFVRLVS